MSSSNFVERAEAFRRGHDRLYVRLMQIAEHLVVLWPDCSFASSEIAEIMLVWGDADNDAVKVACVEAWKRSPFKKPSVAEITKALQDQDIIGSESRLRLVAGSDR